MPRIPGTKKVKITFTCDNTNDRNIDDAISRNEFSSVSEAINTAIRFFFENRDKPSGQEQFKAWVVTEEGEEYLLGLFRKMKNTK